MEELYHVLNTEFPGWRPANQSEDFNGQIIYVVMEAMAFATPEDATQFILKYGARFSVVPTTDLWFDIKPF